MLEVFGGLLSIQHSLRDLAEVQYFSLLKLALLWLSIYVSDFSKVIDHGVSEFTMYTIHLWAC